MLVLELLGLKRKRHKIISNDYKEYTRQNRFFRSLKTQNDDDYLVIVTKPSTHYLAHALLFKLLDAGINCKLIGDLIPGEVETDRPHLIFCPQSFDKDVLPPHYITYQTEQTTNEKWFQPHHLEILKNSDLIIDYSPENIDFLKKNNITSNETIYLPTGYIHDYYQHLITYDILKKSSVMQDYLSRPYDVVFYGDPNNDRRRSYLDAFEKAGIHVKVICGLYGDNLTTELLKSKIILNIHYFENALFETGRIYQTLATGCHIISEKSIDQNEHTVVNDIIDLCETDNIQEMIEKTRYCLENPNHVTTLLDKRKSAPFDDPYTKAVTSISQYLANK